MNCVLLNTRILFNITSYCDRSTVKTRGEKPNELIKNEIMVL